MIKVAAAVVFVVLLALGAGVVTGVTLHQVPGGESALGRANRSALAERLQLTDEQAQNMQKIWEQVRDKVDNIFLDAQELEKDRDQSLFAMLTPEQKAKFVDIQKDYAARIAALKTKRNGLFDQAVTQTEQMLSETQKKQYRQIIAERLDHKSGDDPDWLPKAPAVAPGKQD